MLTTDQVFGPQCFPEEQTLLPTDGLNAQQFTSRPAFVLTKCVSYQGNPWPSAASGIRAWGHSKVLGSPMLVLFAQGSQQIF